MSKIGKKMAKTIESCNLPIDAAIAAFERLNPYNVSHVGMITKPHDIKSVTIYFVGEASDLTYPAGWYCTGNEFINAGNCNEGFAIAVPMERHISQRHGVVH